MGDKRSSIIRTGMLGLRAVRLLIIICILIAAFAGIAGSTNEKNTKSTNDSNTIFRNVLFEDSNDNSSFNSSVIRFESQDNITSSPVSIASGNGYYSSYPISYDSLIGSQTNLASKGAAATLNHAVESAKGISGSAEFMAWESSYQHGDSEYIGETKLQMIIDETVTEGSVNIGALQGDVASEQEPGDRRKDASASSWKNPALEVEEDYIGTYHISKNMTINSHDSWKVDYDSWIGCCPPDHYAVNSWNPWYGVALRSADEVFGYSFAAKAEDE